MADVPTVSYEAIQKATAIVVQIAFSGGEDADPVASLAAWRHKEGFDEASLERSARESAQGSIEEIEEAIREGESFSTEQLREFLEREYMAAAQIFWILRARHDAARSQAATSAG